MKKTEKDKEYLKKKMIWPSDENYSTKEKALYYEMKKKFFENEKEVNSPFVKRTKNVLIHSEGRCNGFKMIKMIGKHKRQLELVDYWV
jgi:hypothetical protein